MFKNALSLLLFLCFMLCGSVSGLFALEDPTYTALRALRPDGRQLAVQGLDLERDVFHLHFETGTFHLLEALDERTLGAVFIGQGALHLRPAGERERRHLAVVTNEPELKMFSDEFTEMVLLFTDPTFAEIEAKAMVVDQQPDADAMRVFKKHLERQAKMFRTNFHLRLLTDMLHETPSAQGVFMAFFKGRELPHSLVAVDPLGVEKLRLRRDLASEDSVLFVADTERRGFWYLNNQKYEVEAGQTHPPVHWAEQVDYTIETEVLRNDDLRGLATLRFQTTVEPLRVLPIFLMSKLRLEEASYSLSPPESPNWQPVSFVQEDDEEDSNLALIFPEPMPTGKDIWLRLAYEGEDILRDVGGENYVVRARQSWYPNLASASDLSHFELTYRIPEGNQLISVGRQVDEKVVDGQLNISFKTEHPIRVAGFNYGRFKRYDRSDGGMTVAVYTNPGTPDIIRQLNGGTQSAFNPNGPIGGRLIGRISTESLADSALVDALNASRVATAYFGPLPQKEVAITQQSQWSSGQSWPSLIFMPYLAFLPSTHRAQLREITGSYLSDARIESLAYHEFAHQWWGHLVGWNSYRDQWLSEGLAEFTAALAVQHTRGWGEYDEHWQRARERLLGKGSVSLIPHHEAGPITQGWRIASHRSRSAYGTVIYQKGAYVMHMLRMMMWDNTSPEPEARFIAMMKDFVESHRDGTPTTDDLQRVVERHMIPEMDVRGDGKVDWFFDQWVHGIEIPRFESDLTVEKAAQGQYRLNGSIVQSEVSDDFVSLLPLYLDFGKGELFRLGMAKMVGNSRQNVDLTFNLPKKPKRVLINARSDVLARD